MRLTGTKTEVEFGRVGRGEVKMLQLNWVKGEKVVFQGIEVWLWGSEWQEVEGRLW